jgi:hypothetical protein
MASFVHYEENASECARLAQIAPSQRGRESFAAAAKHWAMLYRLAAENSVDILRLGRPLAGQSARQTISH